VLYQRIVGDLFFLKFLLIQHKIILWQNKTQRKIVYFHFVYVSGGIQAHVRKTTEFWGVVEGNFDSSCQCGARNGSKLHGVTERIYSTMVARHRLHMCLLYFPYSVHLCCNYRSRQWSSRWNVDWQGKAKFSEKACPSATFVNHKSHMTRPGFEPTSPRWEASDYPPELWRGLSINTYSNQSILVNTCGIELWGCSKPSNTKILQFFQSKTLRMISGTLWYVSNQTLHEDLKITLIQDMIKSNINKYNKRTSVHENQLIKDLFT
jgi:hypothetical protein